MKFTKEDLLYLSGEKFSNAYYMKLECNENCNRIDKIIEICKDKKVIHFGCCDHLPLIESKIENNTWLQKRLEDNCNVVVGIDNNAEAVDYIVKNQYSQRVYCVDVLKEYGKVPSLLEHFGKFDYVIMGEILEHVDNPVLFLEQIRNVFSPYCEKIIITVPNAMNQYMVKNCNKYELINTDHKYWFTPFTIAKVMTEAKILPKEIFFAGKESRIWNKILYKIFGYKRFLMIHNTRSSSLICIGDMVIDD